MKTSLHHVKMHWQQSPFKNSLGWELLYIDICPEKFIPTPIAQGHCSHEVTVSICCQATGHKSTE